MSIRIGFGADLHRLEPGTGFPLCGVHVECRFSAVAISDGDVAVHALVDALLGAMGEGDIGERFPENRAVRGESSLRYLGEIRDLLAARSGRVVNIDLVIDLQRPKLLERKQAMRLNLANFLGLPPSSVNVKAKTGEAIGPIGLSQAVGAQAAVLIELPS
ncbi:MAG: 2-C-methyl-D-erythritol 2,4-cyclodiphosphate synthase [Planctomycetota bacterium]|jgi:2-C-methyl-D-erythritol 2,4-cyclodiphosphate synthase|nr:2-C-methyl-D-erythritol 2,4-cyclodiphosphate synthase [Planctomycetota bacterium]